MLKVNQKSGQTHNKMTDTAMDETHLSILVNDEPPISVDNKQFQEPLVAGGSLAAEKELTTPSVFEIPLDTYNMQPWFTKNVNLNQWFNYGFTPETWTDYASQQMNFYRQSNPQKFNKK